MRGFLGLGSNVGDRVANLRAAVAGLEARGIEVRRLSPVYETAPQGEVLEQRDFLNACAEIETALPAEQLLHECKALEHALGRGHGGVRHGPRPIDVDILLLEGVERASERLTLPHPDLRARRFVLEPLRELAPELVSADMLAAVADQPVTQLDVTLRPGWREAVESRDLEAVRAVLAPEAKLCSPITARIPFEGRERVLELLEEVFAALESVRIVRDVRENGVQILQVESRLAGHDAHLVQVVEYDAGGRVVQITLFMRPLPAVANLWAHLGPRLVRRRHGPVLGAATAAFMRPVAALVKLADRLSPRLV